MTIPKIAAIHIAVIYIVALGLTALLSALLPSYIASFVNFFIPINIDLTFQDFIRYRMALFVSATIVFLILAPIVGWFGIYGSDTGKIQSISWPYFIFPILMIPIGWLGYPFISLCTNCLTSNDIFYYCLTVSFFIALQILFQIIVIKLNTLNTTKITEEQNAHSHTK